MCFKPTPPGTSTRVAWRVPLRWSQTRREVDNDTTLPTTPYSPGTMAELRRKEMEDKRAKLAELRRAREERQKLLQQAVERGSGASSADVRR